MFGQILKLVQIELLMVAAVDDTVIIPAHQPE